MKEIGTIKKIGLVVVFAIFILGCSKQKRAVNKLEGDWIATHYIVYFPSGTIDYISQEGWTLEYTFDKCKVEGENYACSVKERKTIPDGAGETLITARDFIWQINDEGTEINWYFYPTGDYTWQIVSLDRQSAIFSIQKDSGTPVELYLRKV